MAMFGLSADDFEDGSGTYWPDTAEAVELFVRLDTQWRNGFRGRHTGLDYAALYPLLDRQAADAAAWDELFADIQAMESEALRAMNDDNPLPAEGLEDD